MSDIDKDLEAASLADIDAALDAEGDYGFCGDCGAALELVRPGKHQCPNGPHWGYCTDCGAELEMTLDRDLSCPRCSHYRPV